MALLCVNSTCTLYLARSDEANMLSQLSLPLYLNIFRLQLESVGKERPKTREFRKPYINVLTYRSAREFPASKSPEPIKSEIGNPKRNQKFIFFILLVHPVFIGCAYERKSFHRLIDLTTAVLY